MNVLVTGVNGFVGKHLTRVLAEQDCEVVGVGQDAHPNPLIADSLSHYYSCDLTKPEEVKTIKLQGIDAIISLAGLARVGDSFKTPQKYMDINVQVFSVLANRVLADNLSPRIVAISTGAVYDSNQAMPLNEGSRLVNDSSPYVLSKIEMEKTAEMLRVQGLDCIIARPFNHTGPEQETGFLLPDLYKKVTEAEEAGASLKVGNLDTKRDYTDVRDVVRAYSDLALAPNLSSNLYNICSGRSISGKEILGYLLKTLDIKLETVVDDSLLRPNDPAEIYGDYKKLKQDTDWSPAIQISKTVEDFVENTRQQNLLVA